MNAAQWIAVICFGLWGLAHVAFGIFTILPATQNKLFEVYKGVCGAHPNLSEIEQAFKALEAAPRGVNRLFVQHGCNIFKPGFIACALSFYLINNWDKYPFVTFVLTLDIFFDHNFYGVAVDWAGYAPPVANAMLYFANIAVLCEVYDLKDKNVIADWVGILFMVLPACMMAFTTVLHVKRLLTGKTESSETSGVTNEA